MKEIIIKLIQYAIDSGYFADITNCDFGDIEGVLAPDNNIFTNKYKTGEFTVFCNTNGLKRNAFYNNNGFRVGTTYEFEIGLLSKRIDGNSLNLITSNDELNFEVESFYHNKLMDLLDYIQCGFDNLKLPNTINFEILELESGDNYELDTYIFNINQWIYYKSTITITLLKSN